jgi:hypothetical protein
MSLGLISLVPLVPGAFVDRLDVRNSFSILYVFSDSSMATMEIVQNVIEGSIDDPEHIGGKYERNSKHFPLLVSTSV